MAATHGIKWTDVKTADRHGTDAYGQASDGTGTSGNLAQFNADGSLTDSGIAATSVGGSGSAFSEVPSGTLNGVNPTFTLSHTPVGTGPLKSLHFYLNGNDQRPPWISWSGTTVTFLVPPTAADDLYAEYEY